MEKHLGKSIAKATNRKLLDFTWSIRDEAKLEAQENLWFFAGKIIQMMKKRILRPLFLLDEVDKVGNDYRGDPSLRLEALDPGEKEFMIIFRG